MRTGLIRIIFNEEVFKYNADFLSNLCTIILKKEKKLKLIIIDGFENTYIFLVWNDRWLESA